MFKLFKILGGLFAVMFFVVMVALIGFRVNANFQENASAAQRAPGNGQFIETSEGKLHFTSWGPEDGKPVMAVHGAGSWGGIWHKTATSLSKSGYRFIAIDLPPFGFSERYDTDYSRSKHADRIEALAQALDLKNYLMVGHSDGGAAALETALRYPKNVKGLVLIAPVLKVNGGIDPEYSSMLTSAMSVPFVGDLVISASMTNPFATDFLTKRLMYNKEALKQWQVDVLQRPMNRNSTTKATAFWLRQYLVGDDKALSRKPEAIAELKIPTSLIWGVQDPYAPIAMGDELANLVQLTHFTKMNGVGHLPILEDADAFTQALHDELRNVEKAKPPLPNSNQRQPQVPAGEPVAQKTNESATMASKPLADAVVQPVGGATSNQVPSATGLSLRGTMDAPILK